jgi:lipoprotein-releasing system ATP-binding protein
MLITVDNVCKRFDRLEVLRGVSLQVDRGEVVSIVGPSGAGKSTLLQIIGSLDRPDSGRVIFDGEEITPYNERRMAAFRNAHIGFVFQFHRLLPEFTMQENVALPAMIGGMAHREAMDRAMQLIEYMGLRDRAHHRPNALSGGERQRAAVARALINNPDVVLADEPSGSLDSHNRAELHQLFFDLRRDRGQTFLIVTHDEGLAADSDRIIHLADGMVQ